MDLIHCIGIIINDNNDPAPKNVPEQEEKQQCNG